jgi:hypothetical protein
VANCASTGNEVANEFAAAAAFKRTEKFYPSAAQLKSAIGE